MAEHPRRTRRRTGRVILLGALAVMIAATASAAADEHGPGPIDLGTLGGANSFAIGIDPRGNTIVGESEDSNGQIRPVAWIRGRIVDLRTPDAPGEAAGLDVSDEGVVVGTYGQSDDPSATQHGFTWHNGVLRILPGLPGGGGTSARRINRGDEVAGSAFTRDGHEHPVVWARGRIHDLGLPPGFTDGYLLALNDEGDVGGAMFAGDGSEAAFIWHDGTFRALPTLGGPTAQVNVIDDRAVAAGIADTDSNGTSEAALWGRDGAARGLGFFPGGTFSWALGTNGRGDYTGIASLGPDDPLPHVFVAHAGGRLYALPLLSGDYAAMPSIAHGIDLRGDVVGASNTATGDAHGTLWPRAFDQAFIPNVGARPARGTARETRAYEPLP